MLAEERFCPAIGKLCALLIPAVTHFGGEPVVEALIIMKRHLRVIIQPGMNRGLRFRADKMVGGWDVEHQRVGNGV